MLIQDSILQKLWYIWSLLQMRSFNDRLDSLQTQEPIKAIKFFSGMLSNQTLNRETQSIIVLMAMILENNDLAAPILILQLLKVATVVGSVEVRIYTHVFIDVLIHFFHHSTWFFGVLNRISVHCWAIGRSRSNRTRPMWIHWSHPWTSWRYSVTIRCWNWKCFYQVVDHVQLWAASYRSTRCLFVQYQMFVDSWCSSDLEQFYRSTISKESFNLAPKTRCQ